MQEKESFYSSDLAWVHSRDFSKYADEAALFLLDRLKEAGLKNGRIVDLGCGGGQLAASLSENGYPVLGIDTSRDIIELAKEKAPKAKFAVASFTEMELPEALAYTAIGEVFTYLHDPGNTEAFLRDLWRKIYEQLLPGGIFLFDLLAPGSLEGANSKERWIEQPEWSMRLKYEEDERAFRFVRDITLFRRQESGLYRRTHERHTVRTYLPENVKADLEAIGFEVTLLDCYKETHFRPYHFGIFARKRD